MLAVLAAVLVLVSSAESDAVVTPIVLAPHGGAPTIYAGPGDRAQLDGLWRFRRDPDDTGLDKGFQTGAFGGELVRVPYVPDATKISGIRGIRIFRGTIGWYRTHVDVPTDGNYALRFESINHRAQVFIDGEKVAEHKGEYLPFDVRVHLKAGVRHDLVVRADWRGPTAMKRDGWHRLWFNFGGINRGVSIRRIGDSELLYPMLRTRLDGNSAIVDLDVHVHNNTEPRALGRSRHADERRSQDRVRLPRRSRSPRRARRCSRRRCGSTTRSCGRRRRRTCGIWRSRFPARPRTALASGCARSPRAARSCCSTARRSGCAARRSTRTSSAAATGCAPPTRTASSPSCG